MTEKKEAKDSLDRLIEDPDAYFAEVREQAVKDLRSESRGQVIRHRSGGSVIASGGFARTSGQVVRF